MLRIEDGRLRGGGFNFRRKLWDLSREVIEDWSGEDLSPTSLYGIRVYQEGAVLLPHVDRLPLVASAMINIAQVSEASETYVTTTSFTMIFGAFLRSTPSLTLHSFFFNTRTSMKIGRWKSMTIQVEPTMSRSTLVTCCFLNPIPFSTAVPSH